MHDDEVAIDADSEEDKGCQADEEDVECCSEATEDIAQHPAVKDEGGHCPWQTAQTQQDVAEKY